MDEHPGPVDALGQVGVSVHATWLAAVIFAAIGLVREGPAAAVRLGHQDWLAIAYLGVAVTAAAFVMWYSSVGRLGASRAGLLAGVAPVAAAVTGVLLGGPAPRPQVWAGIAVVGVGLALGLRGRGKPGRDDVASRRLWPSRCDIVTVGSGRGTRREPGEQA